MSGTLLSYCIVFAGNHKDWLRNRAESLFSALLSGIFTLQLKKNETVLGSVFPKSREECWVDHLVLALTANVCRDIFKMNTDIIFQG